MSIYNSLFFRVVIRRAAIGSRPFRWELYKEGTVVPLQVSPERFATMEAAHQAGQAALAAMLQHKQKRPASRRTSRAVQSLATRLHAAAAA